MRSLALILTVAVCSAACVQPAHTLRTSEELAYVRKSEIIRCGETYNLLDEDAFPEGSASRGYVQDAKVHANWATALLVTSFVGFIATPPVAISTYETPSGETRVDEGRFAAGLAIFGASIIAYAVGVGQGTSASRRVEDAVNAYNEATFANPEGACHDVQANDDAP